MKILAANMKWKIEGINLIPSDSISQNLKKAIESNNLEESYLQKLTGHLAPINVNRKERVIQFFPC